MANRVVFLRGVNVGRHCRVGMANLRDLLAGLGYERVRTHGQSGNIVLESGLTPALLERELEGRLVEAAGLTTRVFVRTRDELADMLERDPLGALAVNPSPYLVYLLEHEPASKRIRELSTFDVAPESFVVRGRELYAWHPHGVQGSALAKLLARDTLGVAMTARNWNTVAKLLALAYAT